MIQNKWWTMTITMTKLTQLKFNIIPHYLPPQTHPQCSHLLLLLQFHWPFIKTFCLNQIKNKKAETTMGRGKWTNKIPNLQLNYSLPILKQPYPLIRFRSFCAANKRKTNRHFLSLDIHNDLSQLNNKNYQYPLLLLLWNGTDTPIRQYNNFMILHNHACRFFSFYLFLCEKFGSESAHTLSISLHFSSFWSSSKFLSSLLSTNGIFTILL